MKKERNKPSLHCSCYTQKLKQLYQLLLSYQRFFQNASPFLEKTTFILFLQPEIFFAGRIRRSGFFVLLNEGGPGLPEDAPCATIMERGVVA